MCLAMNLLQLLGALNFNAVYRKSSSLLTVATHPATALNAHMIRTHSRTLFPLALDSKRLITYAKEATENPRNKFIENEK